jgi:hypothetical protein
MSDGIKIVREHSLRASQSTGWPCGALLLRNPEAVR